MKKNMFLSLALAGLLCATTTHAQYKEIVVTKDDLKKDVELVTQKGSIVLRLADETPKHHENFIRMLKAGQMDSLNFYRIIKTFLIQTGKDLPEAYPSLIDAEIRPNLFHKRGALNAARMGDDYNPHQSSAALHFTIIQGKVFNDSTLDKAIKRINYQLAFNKVINDPANAEMQKKLQTLLQDEKDEAAIKELRGKFDQLAQEYLRTMTPYVMPEAQRQVYKTIGGAPHLDQSYTVFGEVVKGMDIVDSIADAKTGPGDKPLEDILILKARLIKRIK